MRHYVVDEWADFVRNLVCADQRIEMEQHRATCAECRATLEFLEEVAAFAHAERVYEAGSRDLSASARRLFVQPNIARGEQDCVADFRSLAAYLTYGRTA